MPVGGEHEVLLFWTDLDETSHETEVLPLQERERAARFHRAEDRRHYLAARAWVRTVLAHHAGCDPVELTFHHGRWGKPEIGWPESDLRFNLAHSSNTALLALSRGRPVGVDVEALRPDAFNAAAAALVLSRAELEFVSCAPDRHRAFLLCWTRKEAFAKLAGVGLSRRLAPLTLSGPLAPERGDGIVIADFELGGAICAVASTGTPAFPAWLGYRDPRTRVPSAVGGFSSRHGGD